MCLQHSLDKDIDSSLVKFYHPTGKDMTLETFKYAIKLFSKSVSACLAGVGEPFLNPYLIDMIKLARINNKFVSVISNGTIMSNKISEVINSPLDQIFISLNAIRNEDYSYISCRNGLLFDVVIENINRLVRLRNKRKSKLNINVSFVCHKGNYLEIPEMIEFSKSLGVDKVNLLNLIPTMKYNFVKDNSLYNTDKDVVDFLNSLDLGHHDLDIELPKLLSHHGGNRACKWYFQNLSIDSNGNIGSCGAIMSPNLDYGNIFMDIDSWNNQHFINMREIFLSSSLKLPDICNYCVNNM